MHAITNGLIHRKLGHKQHILIAILLRDFAISMIQFFVPIILLIDGYELYVVALFLALSALSGILTDLLLPRIIGALGVQNTLRLSFFLAIPYIIMLNFVSHSIATFILTATLAGAVNSCYWISRHIDTAKIIGKTKSEQQVGSLEIASALMRIIAPFIGGFIGEFSSTQTLIGVVFGILISASLVISQEAKIEKVSMRHKPRLSTALTRNNIRPQLANYGINLQTHSSAYAWPILIYLSSSGLGKVGSILAFSSVAYIAFTFISSRAKQQTFYSYSGVIGRILVFIMAIVAKSIDVIAASSFLGSATHGLFLATYATDYYSRAKQNASNLEANIISFELIGDFGKLTFCLILAVSSYYLRPETAIQLVFLASIPAVAISSLMFLPQKKSFLSKVISKLTI